MKRLLTIFQELLKTALFFVVAYIWLSYSLDDSSFALVLSIAISLFLELTSFLVARRKQAKQRLKSSQKSDAENMFLALAINPKAIEFFYDLFSSRHKNVTKKENYLIIENLDSQRILFYPILKIGNIEIDDIITIAKLSSSFDKIIISCNEISPSCSQYKELVGRNITLLNKYDTYLTLYKEYDYFPKTTEIQPVKQKISFKNFLQRFFHRSKAKGYIFSGLIVLLSSLYLPYSLYYKIVASVLLVFAIICFVLPSNNIQKELV